MTKPSTLPAIMLAVCCALIPGLLQSFYAYGWIIPIQISWCIVSCLALESLGAKLNKKPIRDAIYNWTWLVTALLIAKSLPVFSPAPYFMLASAIAIIAVKYGAGGLGKNQLNPAMAGLAVVAICFYQQIHPVGDISNQLTRELAAETVWSYFFSWQGFTPPDAISYATPLARQVAEYQTESDYTWIGFGLGGMALYLLRVIRIEIPLSIFSAYFMLELAMGRTPWECLERSCYGGLVFAAFFIATDPVTSPITTKGRIIYGSLIGAIVSLTRANGLYPDGIVFGVLSANLATPHIDQWMWRLKTKG